MVKPSLRISALKMVRALVVVATLGRFSRTSVADWQSWGTYEDILVDRCSDGIARIAINRPAKRNAFRPQTVNELCDAFTRVRDDRAIGVVLFTGVGPADDGGFAFCSGGDQSVRGDGGYVDAEGMPRLNVLDLQRIIRTLPKVVIALVAGYAMGGAGVAFAWRSQPCC